MTAVVKSVTELRQVVAGARSSGQSIRLVPTMGALHEGHASLLRAARADGGFVVVSVFVNPTQFGPREDLSRYPRPFEKDLERCGQEGADLVFAPPVEEVYPPGFATFVEVQGWSDVLEGASRPGHFRGVCTVVLKLFLMAGPDVAYFGQKDAQQVIVLKKMARDLNVAVELRVCPTVREADGLALSSRNVYLSAEERGRALALVRALRAGRDRVLAGERDAEAVRRAVRGVAEGTPGVTLDYAAVVSADSLEPLTRLHGKVLLAIAARVGATRLIDNLLLSVTENEAAEVPV
jgi:pantoate--beta-alanine ligase